MRRECKGSYTVEAAIVMSILLWSIIFSIQYAYRIHDETVGALVLQEIVEAVKYDETGISMDEAVQKGRRLAGSPLYWPEFHYTLKKSLLSVKGSAQAGSWGMEMQMKRYCPEEFLRMTTLFQKNGEDSEEKDGIEERHGDSV